MKKLEERIISEGVIIGNEILKVDKFINHQVDPELMSEMADEFAAHFNNKGITKVATIESSGIAPALFTAKAMGLPLIILKKQPSKVLNENLYQTMVTSFTTKKDYELCLSASVINDDDHVLIIDDFLADGEAVTGAIRLIRMAHATVAGVGILIEKSFQPGRKKIEDQGFDIYSLARIKSMKGSKLEFIE